MKGAASGRLNKRGLATSLYGIFCLGWEGSQCSEDMNVNERTKVGSALVGATGAIYICLTICMTMYA